MFPEIAQLEFKEQTPQADQMGTSFLFDFAQGDFTVRDGRLVKIQNNEAIKFWISKILQTEKYRYLIYERADKNEYGVILEDLLIGRDYPPAFIESELKREITAALLKHPQIRSLSDWKIEKNNPQLKISFKVNLINDSTFQQEVNL